MSATRTCKLVDYPKEVSLRDGSNVVPKPLTAEDAGPVQQFFLRIPAEDRS